MTMSRIAAVLLALLFLVAPIAAARADEWPSRTIRFSFSTTTTRSTRAS
jgi:hypothetical protein